MHKKVGPKFLRLMQKSLQFLKMSKILKKGQIFWQNCVRKNKGGGKSPLLEAEGVKNVIK